MAQLNRNKHGQFDDPRADEIQKDVEKALSLIAKKWSNIDAMDIENIIWHNVPYLLAINITLRNVTRGVE